MRLPVATRRSARSRAGPSGPPTSAGGTKACAPAQGVATLVRLCSGVSQCLALISDQDLLLPIAKNNSHPSIRVRAAERIADPATAQALFADLATSPIEPRFGKIAVARLQDQGRLVKIAQGQAPLETRLEAVKKIADQAILADFALRHEERLLRITAASTLTDPQVLARVADTAPAGEEVEVVKAADNWDAGDGTWIEMEYVPDAREAARARLAALSNSN